VIAPVFLTLFMLFGAGFFINSGSVPVAYRWIKYISFFNYLNAALQKNEFAGLVFDGGYTGDQYIESLNFLPLTVWQNLGITLCMAVGFRLLAFNFVLRNYSPKRFVLPASETGSRNRSVVISVDEFGRRRSGGEDKSLLGSTNAIPSRDLSV
jgi:hypothetical protein